MALGDVQRHIHTHFPGKLEAVVVDVGDHDIARARMPNDRRGHDSDRAGARDQHILAQDIERERGVHGIAQRIEDACHVEVDARPVMPDIRHRQGQIFREGAGTIHAHAHGVRAQVPAPRETVAAPPADHVALAADDFTGKEVVHIFADVDDFADEFVADHHGHGNGFLRPGVPLVNVQVGAADAGAVHADEDIIDPALRIGDILQPEAGFGFRFDEGFHGKIEGASYWRK